VCAGPVRSYADSARGNCRLRELLYFDLLERGIWCARRGIFNVSVPMAEQDFNSLAGAVSDFITERAALFCARDARDSS